MACALTQGYTLPCKDGIGGLRSVRFTEWSNIDTNNGATITASSGVITAMTLANTKKFWKYELPVQNKDKWDEKWNSNNQNGTLFWEQDLQILIRKLSPTLRNELRLLAQNRLACIVETRDNVSPSPTAGTNTGTFWLLGQFNGIELEPSDATTGGDRGDFNGYTLKFKGLEEAPAQQVSSSIISTITN